MARFVLEGEWTGYHSGQARIVRRADDRNKPCPGPVAVTLREQPAPMPEAVLPREWYLRHLHALADAAPDREGLHPSEVALAEHDAALRRCVGPQTPDDVREESEPIHRLLTKRGVPEQIPPSDDNRASLYMRVLVALNERDAAKAALAVARREGGGDAV